MGGGYNPERERGELLMPASHTIVYYRNYSAADTASRSYTQSSATFTLKSVDETGWSAPDGYAFKEWNSLADGTGLGRDPGDTVTSYEWHAIWEQDTAYLTTGSELAGVADAIRTKGGTSAALTYPAGFVSAIQAIPTGGTTQTKTVTPTKSTQSVTPDTGYDGLSLVTVNPIPNRYITPTGNISITANGTVDVTNYASVTVNVSGGGSSLQTCTMTLADGDVTCTGFSDHTPTGAYLAITDLNAAPYPAPLVYFSGADGNARALFVGDSSQLVSWYGYMFGPGGGAILEDDAVQDASYSTDLFDSFAGTYTATVYGF